MLSLFKLSNCFEYFSVWFFRRFASFSIFHFLRYLQDIMCKQLTKAGTIRTKKVKKCFSLFIYFCFHFISRKKVEELKQKLSRDFLFFRKHTLVKNERKKERKKERNNFWFKLTIPVCTHLQPANTFTLNTFLNISVRLNTTNSVLCMKNKS